MSIDQQLRKVDIRIKASDTIEQIPNDKHVLSQGAEESFRPVLGRIHLSNIFTSQTIPDLQIARDFLSGEGGKWVAIIGGSIIGLEAADPLHNICLNVSIIEYALHNFATARLRHSGAPAC